MGLRFRRSIRVCKGVRINVSKSGLSASIGPRGASVTVGKRGTYLNAGIPGTGISSRQKIGGGRSSRRSTQTHSGISNLDVTASVSDTGELSIRGQDGQVLPPKIIAMVRKQNRDSLLGLLNNCCAKFNDLGSKIGEIHFRTPAPNYEAHYEIKAFTEDRPQPPVMKKAGLLGFVMKSRVAKVDAENKVAMEDHNKTVTEWEERRAAFGMAEQDRKEKVESRIFNEVEVMEEALEEALCEIDWPRETIISFDILNEGRQLYIDVDLPEVEDMPTRVAAVQERNLKLGIKDLSEAQVRRMYMQHIHAIGFRIIGESFAAMPTLDDIIISGFSQRPEVATGNVIDEYLYSLAVTRDEWCGINFNNLSVVDPVEALGQFNIRRKMSKTGVFKAIEPFQQA